MYKIFSHKIKNNYFLKMVKIIEAPSAKEKFIHNYGFVEPKNGTKNRNFYFVEDCSIINGN